MLPTVTICMCYVLNTLVILVATVLLLVHTSTPPSPMAPMVVATEGGSGRGSEGTPSCCGPGLPVWAWQVRACCCNTVCLWATLQRGRAAGQRTSRHQAAGLSSKRQQWYELSIARVEWAELRRHGEHKRCDLR